MKTIYLSVIFCLGIGLQIMNSQGSPDYNGGLKVKLDEEGKKYFRLLTWAQVQAVYNNNVPDETNNLSFNLRRARILMYAQINEKFLILTHFGLNSLNSSTMSATGKGEGAQLFFHDVWAQYNLNKDHSVGAGLHYFNGISRLNSHSTLNFLTLDNNRQSWATLGLSDQFVRHLGVFAKGKFGKLQYRLALNDALTNNLDVENNLEFDVDGNVTDMPENVTYYAGKKLLGSKDAGKTFAGYFDYNFLDQESNFLPYKVGSYLGGKKVFNIGAGFFFHPNGAVRMESGELKGQDVSIFAIDAFYDSPLGDNGSALTAYAKFQSNDYGKDYIYGSTYGTGNLIYSHVGYVIPGDISKTRYQPFMSYSSNSYDAFDDNRNFLGIGINAYLSGHNSKLTLEYTRQQFDDFDAGILVIQAMIYL